MEVKARPVRRGPFTYDRAVSARYEIKPAPKRVGRFTRVVSLIAAPCAAVDYPLLLSGEKRQWRQYLHGQKALTRFENYSDLMPWPAVLYVVRRGASPSMTPYVIEGYRSEPLGAITQESLELEGFNTLRSFRRYWIWRHRMIGWRPDQPVHVISGRPWQEDDQETMGLQLLDGLMGDILDGELPRA